jgi:two-component system, NarL family, invasion response regulator UvrY
VDVGVVTVDDQPFFRGAARQVIEATPGFETVGEACSGEEALAIVDELDPQLVLVDVRMPGMDGVQTAKRISAGHPHVVVVLISIEDPEQVSVAARSCGAAALVRKQDLRPRLLESLWVAHGAST